MIHMSMSGGCRYICHLKLELNQKRHNDPLPCVCSQFYFYLFLKQFGSDYVGCHFNTTAEKNSADADMML